jgi:hypothetical protein
MIQSKARLGPRTQHMNLSGGYCLSKPYILTLSPKVSYPSHNQNIFNPSPRVPKVLTVLAFLKSLSPTHFWDTRKLLAVRSHKDQKQPKHQWLMSLMLATWETEIGKIRVPAQSKHLQDTISTDRWAWWHVSVIPSYMIGSDQEYHSSKPAREKAGCGGTCLSSQLQ